MTHGVGAKIAIGKAELRIVAPLRATHFLSVVDNITCQTLKLKELFLKILIEMLFIHHRYML